MDQDFALEQMVEEIAISASARGRRAGSLALNVVRELGPADKEELENPSELGSQTPSLQTIRRTHHELAMLLATGASAVEAGAQTGYSSSRISILQKDPAFMELLAYYVGQREAEHLDAVKRLATLGMSFVDELQDRLETKPEGFTVGQLMAGAELCLDRSVTNPKAPPGGSGVNVTVKFVTPTAVEPFQPRDGSHVIDVEEVS